MGLELIAQLLRELFNALTGADLLRHVNSVGQNTLHPAGSIDRRLQEEIEVAGLTDRLPKQLVDVGAPDDLDIQRIGELEYVVGTAEQRHGLDRW